jgi:hypothetical protein
MPPFEVLPIWMKALLLIFSVLILVIGGSVFWRMLKTVLGHKKEDP